MIHGNTPLAHHLLELPIRNRIRYVPPHAPQDNFPLKLTTLEVDHAASPPPHDQWRSIAESPSCENLRQNRRDCPYSLHESYHRTPVHPRQYLSRAGAVSGRQSTGSLPLVFASTLGPGDPESGPTLAGGVLPGVSRSPSDAGALCHAHAAAAQGADAPAERLLLTRPHNLY